MTEPNRDPSEPQPIPLILRPRWRELYAAMLAQLAPVYVQHLERAETMPKPVARSLARTYAQDAAMLADEALREEIDRGMAR